MINPIHLKSMCDELIATQKCTFYMMCSIQIQDGDVDFYAQIKPRDIFVTVYLSLLFIIGLFGNSLVFFGMVLNHTQMVTASHVYAIHMAFADLLLILVLPLKISQYLNHEEWLFGDTMCKIATATTNVNFIVSIFFLTLMAVDRYIAIKGKYNPIVSRKRPIVTHSISLCIWLIGILICLPQILSSKLQPMTGVCREDWGEIDPLEIANLTESERSNCGLEKNFLSDKFLDMSSQSFNNSEDPFGSLSTDVDCSDKWWEREPEIAGICDDFENNCPDESEIDSCIGTTDGINVCSCPVSARFRSYVVGVFLVCFALPGTVITYCYCSFIKQITKVHRLVRNSANMSNTHQEEIQKLVNVIIFIITAFFLTWGPVQIINILLYTKVLSGICHGACRFLMQLKKNLIWISCAINSVIYICSTGHKKKIKKFVSELFSKEAKKPTTDYETTPNTQRMTIMTNSAVEESVRLHSRPSSARSAQRF